MWPRRVGSGPATAHEISLGELPQLQSWPLDGGAFITLPLVYTEDAGRPGVRHSNLGMYRIQLSGGQYQPNREVGLHYQIHRGIARASCRGAGPGPAAAGEHFRRRLAGHDPGRRDAAARRNERTRRSAARWPAGGST